MAIAKMSKIMIATHQSEAQNLLESLQSEGIVQVLDAERGMVSKEWPELQSQHGRPRDLESMVDRLEKAISFLSNYYKEKDQRSVLRPLIELDDEKYNEIVSGKDALELLEEVEGVSGRIDEIRNGIENKSGLVEMLRPWAGLSIPVDDLCMLETSSCFTGIIPDQHFNTAREKLAENESVIEEVGTWSGGHACIIICFKKAAQDVSKKLRNVDFQSVSFEGMSGLVSDNIKQAEDKLESLKVELEESYQKAELLAQQKLKLEVLYDHYSNLLNREHTRVSAPSTENTVLLEGWVKDKDYPRLEELVSSFSASDVGKIAPAEGESPPVDIETPKAVRPFEVITRLYGMPLYSNLDPTYYLAPFFALFFGLCLTDVGYGLIMVGLLWWMLKKFQGDKNFFRMFLICGVVTTVAGLVTGSWFGDAFSSLVPEDTGVYNVLNAMRNKLLVFDPMEKPMVLFGISIALGYIQIIFGIGIAFVFKLLKGKVVDAIFDNGTWLVFLNSLLLFAFAKGGLVPAALGKPMAVLAIAMAVCILLFSVREGGWGGRVGMGAFELFSTVFYVGDVLSYARIMAIGMVGIGFGMAINVIVKMVMEVQYVGWLLGALIFILGHLFNLAMSMLSAFVHSLRLQYVEFFPKFFEGGGDPFSPLSKKYKHIWIKK